MKVTSFLQWIFLLLFPLACSATSPMQGSTRIAQPISCISSTYTITGDAWWKDVSLVLRNNCGQAVDLKNTTITFNNPDNLKADPWGSFGGLTYPDILTLSSQASSVGYLSTLYFHIADANSQLAAGSTVALYWGAATASFDQASTLVYVDNPPAPSTGSIKVVLATDKPGDVSQTTAPINVMQSGKVIQQLQVPWHSSQLVSSLSPGSYSMQVAGIYGSQSAYQGKANPASFAVTAGNTATTQISYTALPASATGKINLTVQSKPAALTGYNANPAIVLTRNGGSTVNKTAAWAGVTALTGLATSSSYVLSTPLISYNNVNCTGKFTPGTVLSSSATSTPPSTTLTYNCVTISQVNVNVSVSGLTTATNSVDVAFTPNNGSSAVTKTVSLTNGSGSDTVVLNQNVIYTVSASAVSGYNASFNPPQVTALNGASESISYAAIPTSTGGRMIGYLAGWKLPPPASDLANAGYTHILVAFGVFSTTTPGSITPAFDTVTASYIASLHAAGIKVLLSLGGASSSVPNTTVDFHTVLASASSPAAFQQTFVQSVKSLVTQYSFDGIDIDIESGLGVTGSMASPTGDVAVLANILNQLHADLPNLLITMAPQTANISATSGLDATWANYAALIMQTYKAITWVGIQLYNTGCMYGIDHVCYDPNATSSPNFSVAMATDLLADWPSQINGQPSGFQPYISYLRADQVVLGYPSPNAAGGSDGAPVTPTATIKRAIQCLQSNVAGGSSCASYVPPKAYGLIGGVFNWEVSYDQSNQFKFARDLKTCVSTGTCT